MGNGFARRTNLAGERDQMVFAEAGDVDVANQDHFVMVFRKDSIIDHVWRGSNLPFSLFLLGRVDGEWGTREGNEKKKGGREGKGGCDCMDGRQRMTCLLDVPRSLSSSTSRPGHSVLACEGVLLDWDPRRCIRGRCALLQRV